MNKIILQFGLLTFTLSIIFFSRVGLPVYEVLLKSFLIFLAVTVLLSLITIVFIRAVNKASSEKSRELNKKIS